MVDKGREKLNGFFSDSDGPTATHKRNQEETQHETETEHD